ncbi:MarR family winged helix-turn-helix transcriptional regulator [Streptomyces sp. NPDC056653]
MGRLGMQLAWHGKITDTRMRRALSATGLTPRHAMTLMNLGGGPVSQQALIEQLGVDPSSVVSLLNDLENDDLVRRRRDPADRRRHIVEITDEGAETLSRLEAALAKVEDEMFVGLSAEERTLLGSLLTKISASHSDYDCA